MAITMVAAVKYARVSISNPTVKYNKKRRLNPQNFYPNSA